MQVQVGKTKYNISMGAVIFFFSMLVTVIGGYLTLQNNITNMQEDIKTLQAQVEEVKDNSGVTGIIELRGLLDVTSTKLNYIEKTLDALDSAIR
jgi:archaellum component FlaF (FlaF/FlaG flagellin family)